MFPPALPTPPWTTATHQPATTRSQHNSNAPCVNTRCAITTYSSLPSQAQQDKRSVRKQNARAYETARTQERKNARTQERKNARTQERKNARTQDHPPARTTHPTPSSCNRLRKTHDGRVCTRKGNPRVVATWFTKSPRTDNVHPHRQNRTTSLYPIDTGPPLVPVNTADRRYRRNIFVNQPRVK